MSVKVISYEKKTAQSGGNFYVLTIANTQPSLTQSEDTGSWFMSTQKANIIASGMSKEECAGMVGQVLPGSIVKQASAPYEYTVPSTGEKKVLDYKYVYQSQMPVDLSEINEME